MIENQVPNSNQVSIMRFEFKKQIHTYIRTYVRTYTYIHAYVRTYTDVHTYVYINVFLA